MTSSRLLFLTTGKREKPVRRASAMIADTGSSMFTVYTRTREVMTSRAVNSPKASERSSIRAVSWGKVPFSAERRTKLASSSAERAEANSSRGSRPKRRKIKVALPLKTMIGPRIISVNRRMIACTRRAVPNGIAMATYLGTNSPSTIVMMVAIARPIIVATVLAVVPCRPKAAKGLPKTLIKLGSAKKPMARLVMVIPTWAPDNWVLNDLRASKTPAAW